LISESGSGNQNKFFPDPNISESLVTIFEVKKLQFFGQLAQFFSVLFEKLSFLIFVKFMGTKKTTTRFFPVSSFVDVTSGV
jgi:hypothetical protein